MIYRLSVRRAAVWLIPFAIVAVAFVMHRFLWTFINSPMDLIVIFGLAGISAGLLFEHGAARYLTTLPVAGLTALTLLNDWFGVDVDWQWGIIPLPFLAMMCVIPLGLGIRAGRLLRGIGDLSTVRINWERIRGGRL